MGGGDSTSNCENNYMIIGTAIMQFDEWSRAVYIDHASLAIQAVYIGREPSGNAGSTHSRTV